MAAETSQDRDTVHNRWQQKLAKRGTQFTTDGSTRLDKTEGQVTTDCSTS